MSQKESKWSGFQCTKCKSTIDLESDKVGSTIFCPICGSTMKHVEGEKPVIKSTNFGCTIIFSLIACALSFYLGYKFCALVKGFC